MAGRPTLSTVATAAGVSRQTVSNVLNSPEVVRPETLDRVRAVIAEVGYQPNLVARQLRTRESRVIGLRLGPVSDGINGSILDQFLHAVTQELQARNYRIMLFTAEDSESEMAEYPHLLENLNLDGFVLTSTHAQDPRTRWLSQNEIPYVTFGRPWAVGESLDHHAWVDVDGNAGTYAATKHLLNQGHSNIAFVGWPVGSETGDDRRSGWEQALREHNGDHRPKIALSDLVFESEDGAKGGGRAVKHFLAKGPAAAPTAYVCVSDSLALGVLSQLTRMQRQAAVVGFDNTPVAKALGITSVKQPIKQAARVTAELLISAIQKKDSGEATQGMLLAPTLELRMSTEQ